MAKSFSDTNNDNQPIGNNLLVVDGLNLAFRYKHINKKDFSADYMATVNSLAKSYECGKIVITADAGSKFRKDVYPDYKANRKALREKQTEEERKQFKEFIEEFERTLELAGFSYPTFKFSGVEADDIIAYITKKYTDQFDHIWVISSDKDLDQLISENVSRFSYINRKEVTYGNWYSHYDYDIEDHISIKVLMGDKGDNVPGVPGVGIKRAMNIVREYGSAFDVYDALPINKPHKYIQNLNNFGEQIMTNYELMDLPTFCEDALLSNTNIDLLETELDSYFYKE